MATQALGTAPVDKIRQNQLKEIKHKFWQMELIIPPDEKKNFTKKELNFIYSKIEK